MSCLCALLWLLLLLPLLLPLLFISTKLLLPHAHLYELYKSHYTYRISKESRLAPLVIVYPPNALLIHENCINTLQCATIFWQSLLLVCFSNKRMQQSYCVVVLFSIIKCMFYMHTRYANCRQR